MKCIIFFLVLKYFLIIKKSSILILIHLCSLESFGVPYLTPYTAYVKQYSDLKDTFIRAPWPAMRDRETTVKKSERKRMRDYRDEDLNKEE